MSAIVGCRGSVEMKQASTVEDRILDRFFEKLEESEVPKEITRRLLDLRKQGQIDAVDGILDALREGMEEHAENSAS